MADGSGDASGGAPDGLPGDGSAGAESLSGWDDTPIPTPDEESLGAEGSSGATGLTATDSEGSVTPAHATGGGGKADGLEGARVFIDPGHGGNDWGTCYGLTYEKHVVLEIALRLGERLAEGGLVPCLSRTEDVDVDYLKIADMANERGCELTLSIHINSMPGNPDYRGTETLYSNGAGAGGSFTSKDLASIVQSNVHAAMGSYDIGIIEREGLAVLRLATIPTVIVELGFMTHEGDRGKLLSEEYRAMIVEALYDSVVEALVRMRV
ncbi:MAG: N-acetylmuramoyl-L-alanine amidase [Oscillospiraceae bacterium]|nr:N-acetylmuramoyl-L-alanine amidase [Oscillospiraceae bacterium]